MSMEYADKIKEAHGILGCLAWAALAPLGALLVRVVPSTKAWVIHGGFMLFVLAIITANFGMGLSRVLAYPTHVGATAHYIIGTTLFSLAWLQPFVGTAHHFLYKATGKRSILAAAHVFFGRVFMLVGVVNGGVGLLLAGTATRAEHIVYGTLVGTIWVSYILVSLGLEVNRTEKRVKPAHSFSGSQFTGSDSPVEGSSKMG